MRNFKEITSQTALSPRHIIKKQPQKKLSSFRGVVQMCVKGVYMYSPEHSSFGAIHLLFGGRLSHWTRTSLWVDWLTNKLQGCICLSLHISGITTPHTTVYIVSVYTSFLPPFMANTLATKRFFFSVHCFHLNV